MKWIKSLKKLFPQASIGQTSEKNQREILKNYIREDSVKVLYDNLSSE